VEKFTILSKTLSKSDSEEINHIHQTQQSFTALFLLMGLLGSFGLFAISC